MRKYTFVTVFFDIEYAFVLLQARSMRVYCPSELVDSIVLINNSNRPLPSRKKLELLSAFGNLANFVSFRNSRDVVRMPKCKGWVGQQILKLTISNEIDSERYVVLDAKNHLILPLSSGFLESESGAALARSGDFRKHILRPYLERALDYFNVRSVVSIDRFPATVTPFVIYTDLAKHLIREMELRENDRFPEVFLKKQFTEFFLYSAYVIYKNQGFLPLYQLNGKRCPIAWKADARGGEFRAFLDRCSKNVGPFIGIHRQAIGNLDQEASDLLTAFWVERKLFQDVAEARSFLAPFHRRVRRKILGQKVRGRFRYYVQRAFLFLRGERGYHQG